MKQIIGQMESVAEHNKNPQILTLVKMLKEILSQCDLGLSIQDSSSKIMKSIIGDLLDFA